LEISDLTEKAGVLINTISSIEREKTQPRRDTMEKIQKAFEDAGVEFMPDSGVRLKIALSSRMRAQKRTSVGRGHLQPFKARWRDAGCAR
jgi:transcriptional regulator with XRE-family HTH domain